MIEYPRQGFWSIGFVTETMSQSVRAHLWKPVPSVSLPITPNPTSSWHAIVPEKDEVITLNFSSEDAFKNLISGGIVNPDNPPVSPLALPKTYQKEVVAIDKKV